MTLSVNYSFVGNGDWSLDAVSGSSTDGGLIEVLVPAGATVEAAFLYASGFNFTTVAGSVEFGGVALADDEFESLDATAGSFLRAFRADVTEIVVDAAGSGSDEPIEFELSNVSSPNIDGYALAVVYSDPSAPVRSIAFADGGSATTGDGFQVEFFEPVDTSEPDFSALLSLGIGFGFQGPGAAGGPSAQFSTVDVDGRRLASFAGGQDDGTSANGGLITLGGISDDPTNPANPFAVGVESRFDDELYDLSQGNEVDETPFLPTGATSIGVATRNPSNDDNLFFVGFNISGEVIVDSDGNDRPTAVNDSFSVPASGLLSSFSLLENDIDPDGDTLTITDIDTSSTVGTVVNLGNGEISYDPNGQFDDLAPGARAFDGFSYTIDDGRGGVDTAFVTVTIEGPTPFEIDLALPDVLSVGETGTATLTYNDERPSLIALTAERGLFRDPLTGGFSETAFLLTDGSLGEETIEVDVRGSAGPRASITGIAQLADTNAITDLTARYVAFQPDFLDASVVARIEDNITVLFGTTIASLTTSLVPFADRLASFGLESSSASGALAFAFEAAADYGSIQERGMSGSLGQGWASLADLGLEIDGTSVLMSGLTDIDALRALSVDAAALYTVSSSAGRSVSLAGYTLALTAPARPNFEQLRDGSFATTSAFDGTLSQTDDGYVLSLPDGDAFIFDEDGTFLRLETADGLQITATYDGDGNIVALSGPNGEELTFDRRADGLITQIEDADGETVALSYDAPGQLQNVTRPDGTSTFGYNAAGDLTSATAPGGIEAAFVYDTLGRLDSASYGGGAQTEDIAYDNAGGVTITDGAGTVTEIDLLSGSVVGRITDANGGVSEIFYNESGDLAGVRAPDGTETGFEFDDQGRLTKITDANGAEFGFSYVGSAEEPASFTDAGGNTRSFTYDAGGRITEATWPDGTELQFSYDATGNLTGYTNRRGDDITYTYDSRGRLLTESDSSAGPTTYIYDAQGRLTSATNDQGTTSLTYDSADRVTQIEYPMGRSLTYTYNEAGLRSSMSDGAGYELFYDYDALGRLTELSNSDGTIVTYTYDAGGNLVREENGNGTVSTFDYDAAGRLTRIENQAPDSSINSFNAYTYDTAGQRITNDTQDGTWTYGYDAAGQLTSADFASINPDIADKSLTYEYDAAGNRTRLVEDGVETLYTANALNQYTTVGDATFTYDDDGNMTSRTDGDGTTTYTYDLDNRLTSITQSDGTVLEFAYDLFGNRVGKTVDGAETEYLIDPFGFGDVIAEFQEGLPSATYTHGLGLVSGEIGGEVAFYDADAVGSVATLTNSAGSAANSYAYTPFGKELLEVEGIKNAFDFSGILGVTEDTADLTYMRARSYSDELGRFLSEDPLFFRGDPENLMRFAFNNPTSFSDPSGENAAVLVGAGIVVVSVGASLFDYFSRRKQIDEQVPQFDQELRDLALKDANNDLAIDLASEAFLLPFIKNVLLRAGAELVGGIGLTKIIKDANNPDLTYDYGDFLSYDVGPDYRVPSDVLNDLTGDPEGVYGPDDDGDGIPDNLPPGASYIPPVDPANPFPDDTDTSRVGPADGDTRNYGDPHLITFDRTGYSFQALGEFTMVIGDGFEMQVRMEAITDVASVNTAVAMRVGDDVIGVYSDETIPLVANGTAVFLTQDESVAVGDFTLYRTTRGDPDDPANAEYIVTAGSGNGFYVRVFDGALNILPFVSDDAPVAGLLGNLDADRSNDFALRDGTVLPQPLAQTVLYGEYADSWRIDGDGSLFLYRDGESTETFTDRSFPPNIVTLDDLDPAARAEAEAIAEAAGLVPGTFIFETTVIDIVLTQNSAFAEAIADVPEFAPADAPDDVDPVEINEAPVAGDDNAEVAADGTVDIAVLDNDSDPEGDDLFLVEANDANGGTAQIVGNLVRFTPAPGFSGPTVVSYQLGDAAGNIVTGSILIDVMEDPSGPIAVYDAGEGFLANEDAPFTTASVLKNDRSSGGELSVDSIDTAGTLGLVTDNGDGTFSYDPNGAFEALAAGERATDSFIYRVRDDGGISAPATVEITVDGRNDAPAALDDDDDLMTPEETPITIDVLANDSDVDASDVLRIQSVASSLFGVAEIVDDRVVFTPNAGVTGGVDFDYTISDGDLMATATVTVFVGTDAFDPPMKLVGTKENDDLVGGNSDDIFLLRFGDDAATGEGGADNFIIDSRSIQSGDTYTINDFDTSEGDRVVFRFFDQRREIRSDEELEFYIDNGFATVVTEDRNEKTIVFQNLDLNFGSAAETFIGTRGDDIFDGMNGNDSFLIRGGSDTATGGLDADTFIFDGRYVGSDSLHTITDLDFAEGDVLTLRFWNSNDRRVVVNSEEDLGALEDFTWAELENTSLGRLVTLTNEANESLQIQFI